MLKDGMPFLCLSLSTSSVIDEWLVSVVLQFQEMMKRELWRYSRRELNNVLSVSGDEQFRSIILMYGCVVPLLGCGLEGGSGRGCGGSATCQKS